MHAIYYKICVGAYGLLAVDNREELHFGSRIVTCYAPLLSDLKYTTVTGVLVYFSTCLQFNLDG